MRLIILGAPGAGKGTQAVNISKHLNIPHISTGDIFRANIKGNTELGKKAKAYIDKGELVPDELTVDLVKDRLKDADCSNGFILDGFPRTIPQAEYLDNILSQMGVNLDVALLIDVNDDEIIKRMSGRRVCTKCGMTYHIKYNPTKVEGICDSCNSPVVLRADDGPETVLKRLQAYHKQTQPLIQFYKASGKLKTAEGSDTLEETSNRVKQVLGM